MLVRELKAQKHCASNTGNSTFEVSRDRRKNYICLSLKNNLSFVFANFENEILVKDFQGCGFLVRCVVTSIQTKYSYDVM